MICSPALIYILLANLSDLTAPLPWTQHTSVKGFIVLQKQVQLHTNRQRVEMLRAISLLLKAFSGRPLLPIVVLQRCCRLPPVRHGCKPSLPSHFRWIHAWIGCAPHPITLYSVLSIKDAHNAHKSLTRGFLPFFLPSLFLYFRLPTAKDSACLVGSALTFPLGRRGGILNTPILLHHTNTTEWKDSRQGRYNAPQKHNRYFKA